jgi:hypothetical protein
MPYWLPADMEAYARLVHTIHTLEAAASSTGSTETGWLFATPDALAPWDALTPAHRRIDHHVATAVLDKFRADQEHAPAYGPDDARTLTGLARQLLARAALLPPAGQARILGFDPGDDPDGVSLTDPDRAERYAARLATLGRAELRRRITQAQQTAPSPPPQQRE